MSCSAIRNTARSVSRDGPERRLKTCKALLAAAILLVVLTPGLCRACACGCGVFEVGTSSLFPEGAGGTAWLEYDFMDQYLNWHSSQIASAAANSDKVIRTHFVTLGAEYMINRNWGVMAEIPYWSRYFKTTGDQGQIQGFTHDALGDVRIYGMYTGLQEDMSTGLLAGLKLPSGDYTYPNFDRDTEIGSGSTDLLLGAYHQGTIPWTLMDRSFGWFSQMLFQQEFITRDHYIPGKEFDAAVGGYYNIGAVGSFIRNLAPLLSLLLSDRAKDSGSASNAPDSGYTRLLLAAGIEIKIPVLRLYLDAEVPVYQNMNGNQLTAPVLLKSIVSYDF